MRTLRSLGPLGAGALHPLWTLRPLCAATLRTLGTLRTLRTLRALGPLRPRRALTKQTGSVLEADAVRLLRCRDQERDGDFTRRPVDEKPEQRPCGIAHREPATGWRSHFNVGGKGFRAAQRQRGRQRDRQRSLSEAPSAHHDSPWRAAVARFIRLPRLLHRDSRPVA